MAVFETDEISVAVFVAERPVVDVLVAVLVDRVVREVVLAQLLAFYVLLIRGRHRQLVVLRNTLLVALSLLRQVLVYNLVVSFDFHIFRAKHNVVDRLQLGGH